ncbi:MAG TPA: tetratricopeptide repeat protein, partial [Pyrinomonadaceae bacterium]|nr:tetratricopeptide repeat protein [Pyrinomonadaceae bacterium]
MRDQISLRGRAWVNIQSTLSFARRASSIVIYGLTFCVAAAHGQAGAGVAPTSGAREQKTAPVNSRTRARRVSAAANESGNPSERRGGGSPTASDSASAADTQEEPVQPSSAEAEEPAPTPDRTQKGDRLSALRAQISEATDKSERARLQRTLADYLVALNRKSEAIQELRAMAVDERVDPVGFYNIGNALARLGDTDGAIEAYRKAIDQRHGNYARALNNLGVVLMRGKRWTEALEALSKALRQENFRYGEASYNLGRLHAARGE